MTTQNSPDACSAGTTAFALRNEVLANAVTATSKRARIPLGSQGVWSPLFADMSTRYRAEVATEAGVFAGWTITVLHAVNALAFSPG
jgi:hypothetical protein